MMMRTNICLVAAALAVLFFASGAAQAQQSVLMTGKGVADCNTGLPTPGVVDRPIELRTDLNGHLCISGGGGVASTVAIDQTTPGTSNAVAVTNGVAGGNLGDAATAGNVVWTQGIVYGSANYATSQVTCANTATAIFASSRATRVAAQITMTQATAVYIGATNGVTTATGAFLAGVVGASKTIPTQTALYCITASGTSVVTVEEHY